MPIEQIVPDVDDFLAMSAEEVGWVVLEDLKQRLSAERHPGTGLTLPDWLDNAIHQTKLYDGLKQAEVRRVLTEGWDWLVLQGLLASVPIRGSGGLSAEPRKVPSRLGERLNTPESVAAYRKASAVPWQMLHEIIRAKVKRLILEGDYDAAVLLSFKEVEVAVRDACPGWPADKEHLGVSLMRKAFAPSKGPLADKRADGGEQQALCDLFAGAVGSYKNPQSHRHVGIPTVDEAVEMVMLASHLLRIVDTRRGP